MQTTLAIVGAGPGLGASVARRFGKDDFTVALISRSQTKLDRLATELSDEDLTAQGFAADVRDTASMTSALENASASLVSCQADPLAIC